MSDHQEILPLRPNVCMLVLNGQGLIFMGERQAEPGVWQFPQGGVDPGLPPEESVLRELYEELGAEKERFRILVKLPLTHEYEWTKPKRYGKDKWRGQIQTFWGVRFVGQDSEIKLDRFHPEFMNWKWVRLEEAVAMAEPVRRASYEQAVELLTDFLKRNNPVQHQNN